MTWICVWFCCSGIWYFYDIFGCLYNILYFIRKNSLGLIVDSEAFFVLVICLRFTAAVGWILEFGYWKILNFSSRVLKTFENIDVSVFSSHPVSNSSNWWWQRWPLQWWCLMWFRVDVSQHAVIILISGPTTAVVWCTIWGAIEADEIGRQYCAVQCM